MDILEIVRRQIGVLPEGPHIAGLQSVLRHIETAHRHLSRGQEQQDYSAFTDAIYRTNQAFEGSIKEAYRVLASKDPSKATPYQIEQYLQQNKIFRDRVLSQFTSYRTEWRNPSTHDYNLDFNEDEAFLAIVSVSAFTKLMLNQVTERLAFVEVEADLKEHNGSPAQERSSPAEPLAQRIAAAILSFVGQYLASNQHLSIETEMQLLGALAGYLSKVEPSVSVALDQAFGEERRFRADMVATSESEKLIIELKRTASTEVIANGLRQVEAYLQASQIRFGLLFAYGGRDVQYTCTMVTLLDGEV